MSTLGFPQPPTTLYEKTDEDEDTDDCKRIEQDLNQYRECGLCYSTDPETERVAGYWQYVFGETHIWIPRHICGRVR